MAERGAPPPSLDGVVAHLPEVGRQPVGRVDRFLVADGDRDLLVLDGVRAREERARARRLSRAF